MSILFAKNAVLSTALVLAVAAAAASSNAAAQEAEQTPPPDAGTAPAAEPIATIPVQELASTPEATPEEKRVSGKSVELDAVVVTARKRKESLQKVPVAITVFSAKQMEQRGFTGLEDIAASTPGFTFEGFSSGGAHGNPVIRGLANQFTTTRIQNVSFFLDGVYLQRQSMLNLGLIDMDRVEVVKGPQNALYGRNAFSGAVNYVTEALPHELDGYVFSGTGDNGRRDYRISVAGPINRAGTVLGKFTVGKSSYDGDSRNNHPIASPTFDAPHLSGNLGGHDDLIYSMSLGFEPSEALRVRGSYYLNNLRRESKAAYSISGVNAARFGLRFDDQNDLNCNTASVRDIQPQPPRNHTGFSAYCGELPKYASDIKPRTVAGIVIDPRAVGSVAKTAVITLNTDYNFTDGFAVHYLYGDARHTSFTDGGPSDEDPLAGRGININAAITQVDNQDPRAYEFANTASSRPNSILKSFSHELRFDWQPIPMFRTSFGAYYSGTKDQEWTNLFINDLCNDATPQNIANCNSPSSTPNTLAQRTVITSGAGYDLYTRQAMIANRGEDTKFSDDIKAVFSSFTFTFANGLNTTLEGRYSIENKVVDRLTDSSALAPGQTVCYGVSCTPPNTAPVVPGAGNSLTSNIVVPHDQARFADFTPRAIINWDFAKSSMVYFSAAKGVKAGGFNNAVTPAELRYEPETNLTYELGSKNRFFHNTFTFNTAIYYVNWSKLQAGVPPSNGSFSTSDVIANLGGASNLGVELETILRLSKPLSIDFGGSYSNPTYKKGVKYSAGIQSTGAIHCDGVTCPADGDIGGNQLSRTSKQQLILGLNYDLGFNGWKIGTRVDGQYQSRQYVEPLNLAWVPSRLLWNASLKVLSANRDWELGLWGKNLTDEDYASNSFLIGVFNQYIVGKGQRRTFGANLKYKF